MDQRKQLSLQDAPLIAYTKEPPAGIAASNGFVYICIVLLPHHYARVERRERSVNLVLSFRDYLHYHLKTTMAFLHTRMRKKTLFFLQKLNNKQ